MGTMERVSGSTRSSGIALSTVCLVLFLTFLDTTIVSVALGDIQGDLHAGVISLQWVVNSYTLVFARLMLTAGSVALLIAGRAVMGVGAAASEPGTLAVIFWFNLIVGVILVAVAIAFVPESADPQQGRIDIPGFLLGSTFLGCVIYAGIAGQEVGYSQLYVMALFAIRIVALGLFIFVELRAVNPMFNFRYLRIPIVGSALTVAFVIYFGIFAIFFFSALYLQEVVGYSPWRTAAVFAPMAAAIVVGSLASGVWTARTHANVPMLVGCLLSGVGIFLARAQLHQNANFTLLALSLMVAGAGFGIAVVPLTSAVLSGAPAEHSGMAAAATNTMRQVGAVVGVAALGGLVNANLTSGLKDRLRELDIPANFDLIIINAIETGSVPQGGGGTVGYEQSYGSVVNQVIQATYDAFHAGLDTALLVSALLSFAAAIVVALGLWRQRQSPMANIEASI